MAKVYTFLTERFETVEALCVVDILRRAGVVVETVSTEKDRMVMSAQKINVEADKCINDEDFTDGDAVFLPGGPGTPNLEMCEKVIDITRKYYDEGKFVSAICAAPSILGHMGLLEGRKATCFPGYETELKGATHVDHRVVVDGNVITSKGMGTSVDLGLKLVELLVDENTASELSKKIQYK